MELYHYVGIIGILGIAYFVIKGRMNYKNNTKKLPNVIYQLIGIIYPPLGRKGLIVKYINEERAKECLIITVKNTVLKRQKKKLLKYPLPLKAGFRIDLLSQRRAERLDINNYLSHTGAVKPFIVLRKDGSDGEAEVLTGYFSTARGVVNGFMGSDTHRKAILSPEYDYCGVGCKYDTTPPKELPKRRNLWIDIVLLVDEKTVNP